MPKYSRRDSEAWTLSSTALGWALTGVAIFLVVFFGAGFYVGYNWGFEEGTEVAVEERPELPEEELAALLEDEEIDFEDFDFDQPEFEADPEIPEEEVELLEDEPALLVDEETPVEDVEPVEREMEPGLVTEEEPEPTEPDEPEVEVDPDTPSPPEIDEPELEEEFYTIQVASSENRESAEHERERLEAAGYPAVIEETTIEGDDWHRVRVGEFPTRSQAEDFAEEMIEDGEIDSYWISIVEN